MKKSLGLALSVAVMAGCSQSNDTAPVAEKIPAPLPSADVLAARCSDIAQTMQGAWPDATTRITNAVWHAEPYTQPAAGRNPAIDFPAHCEISGSLQQREGYAGEQYAINFQVRMPADWNGRFLFQGGGGTNGVVRDAVGFMGSEQPNALMRGFAVVSQDSGHDNSVNNNPAYNGTLTFAFDPQALSNYSYTSLKPVADTAKAVVGKYFDAPIQYSYFYGCSKGGHEGMQFVQRYPEAFDGVIAKAPAFSLPRAALAELHDNQQFTKMSGADQVSLDALRSAMSDAQLASVADAILEACDADDGVVDGMVLKYGSCTTERVLPTLQAKVCDDGEGCLNQAQVDGLVAIMSGPKTAEGEPVYTDWAWDPGIASPGWRTWKLGSADGRVPALNIVLGGVSYGSMMRPEPMVFGPESYDLNQFLTEYDISTQYVDVYNVRAGINTSTWDLFSARSPDISAFKAAGGKLMMPHGVSDPVFSVNDGAEWYDEMNQVTGDAEDFVRVYPIPGMAHCAGGPATEQFDALSAMQAWVEQGEAPVALIATASEQTPWPGRSRPICPYPSTPQYDGSGDVESAASFSCR